MTAFFRQIVARLPSFMGRAKFTLPISEAFAPTSGCSLCSTADLFGLDHFLLGYGLFLRCSFLSGCWLFLLGGCFLSFAH